MSETGGLLDAYLLCQALGWEWNFWNMVIITIAPILIFGGGIFLIFFVLPYVLDKTSKFTNNKKR